MYFDVVCKYIIDAIHGDVQLVAAILLGNGVGGSMAVAPHYKLVGSG